MKLNRFRTLLAITAGIVVASGAIATTWDATAQFTPASNSGVWQYGTCSVSNIGWASTGLDVNGYAFSADTYTTVFNDYGAPCSINMWAKSATGNTNWGNNGEPLAWTGLNTGGPSSWQNGGVPIFPGIGLYVEPYAIGDYTTGDATVLRWTAPIAGTFNMTGSVYDCLNGYLVDQLIQTDAQGNRHVVHSIDGSPLTSRATDSFSGSVTLGAGDTLDLIVYQSPVYQRAFGKINLTLTSQDTPEPGSLLALGAGLVSFGGLVLRRRK